MYHSLDVAKYMVYCHIVRRKDITLSRLRVLMYFLQMYWLFIKPKLQVQLERHIAYYAF